MNDTMRHGETLFRPKPVAVPLVWESYDCADLCDRAVRDGYLYAEELWEPQSDDGWRAFCRFHGTYGFDLDWREMYAREHASADRERERYAAEQEAAYARQLARIESARRSIEAAKSYWSRIDARFGTERYVSVTIHRGGMIAGVPGVQVEAGKEYWVPSTISQRLLGAR